MEKARQAICGEPALFRTGSLETECWCVAACAVAGPGHRARGLGCDDNFAWRVRGEWVVACVCDGAGSAPHGAIGSLIGARTVCDVVAQLLPDDIETAIGQVELEQAVIAGIGAARNAVERDAGDRGAEMRQYHATLVGIVARGSEALLFHIGDGAAVAIERTRDDAPDDRAHAILSPPENGAFSNQTQFFTLPRWRDHLRFTPVGGFDMVALMTDGVTPFALDRGGQHPLRRFIDPICATLDDVPAQVCALALRGLLDREDVRAACDDDKTILWLARAPCRAPDGRGAATPDDTVPGEPMKIDVVTYVLLRRRQRRLWLRRQRRGAAWC